MITGIDHIAVVVKSLEEAIPFYRRLLGGEPSEPEVLEEQGVRLVFFDLGGGRLELIEPLSEANSIARFLRKRGPGIHHISLKTDDLEGELKRAAEEGGEVLGGGSRRGAHGTRVAFLHPRSTGGVLLELSEEKNPAEDEADGG